MYGFSPVCVRMCVVSVLPTLKLELRRPSWLPVALRFALQKTMNFSGFT